MSSPDSFGQLDLSILGIGTEYPPFSLKPDAVETLARRFHNVDGNGMKKVLSINRFTGIEVRHNIFFLDKSFVCGERSALTLPTQSRSSIGTPDHSVVNHPDPPSVEELHKVFMKDGVPLAIRASQKAITEAGISAAQIVSVLHFTPCMNKKSPQSHKRTTH